MDIVLFVLLLAITLGIYIFMNVKIKKYKNEDIKALMSGFEVSRKIIDGYDLNNVYITESRDALFSHYDPERKVIRLLKGVFNDTSISSCAIASLTAANTIQDKKKDSLYLFRKKMIPFLDILLYFSYIVIACGTLFGRIDIILIGIIIDYLIIFFHMATYKIELEAVEIAKQELERNKIVTKKEAQKVYEVLRAISLTYIASIMFPIAKLVKLIIDYGNSNKN